MYVIITAAGLGSRLGGLTRARPKCLLRVGGATLLDHQLRACQELGLQDVVLVRGHAGASIARAGLSFVDNPDYATTNVLHSLMCAAEFLDRGFVCSYSDILYDTQTLRALLEADDDLAIVVDPAWRHTYQDREQHPVEEAEKVVIDDAGCVRRIGKHMVRAEQAQAEFIGLMKATPRGAWLFKQMYERGRQLAAGAPATQILDLRRALLSEFLQHLVDHRVRVRCIPVEGSWHEIDTPQDLDIARRRWQVKESCT